MAVPAYLFINTLLNSDSSFDVVSLVFIVTLFLGGCGLIITGIRGVTGCGQNAAEAYLDHAIPGSAVPKPFPASPGSNGYYRLKPKDTSQSEFWQYLGFTIFWYSFLSAGFVFSKMYFVIVPLLLVGIFLIVKTWKLYFSWRRAFAITAEVDLPTVTPGQTIKCRIAKRATAAFDRLAIDLVCREKATYDVGSTLSTDYAIVREFPVDQLTDLSRKSVMVLTNQSVTIPPDAMLSFKASRNAIDWHIRATVERKGQPVHETFFPLLVVSPGIRQKVPHVT